MCLLQFEFIYSLVVPASSLTLTSGFPLLPVSVETPLSVTCRADGGYPAPLITWWKHQQLLTTGEIYNITTRTVSGENSSISTLSLLALPDDADSVFQCRTEGVEADTNTSFTIKGKYFLQYLMILIYV